MGRDHCNIMAEEAKAKATEMLHMATATAKAAWVKETTSGELNRQYYTLEDFKRCPHGPKRVVVIGCSGAGKSTLLNVMGGWKFVQNQTDYEWGWEEQDGTPPLFKASDSVDSVTQETSFASLNWFGDDSKPFVAVDTPGHDDTSGRNIEDQESRDKLRELAADL